MSMTFESRMYHAVSATLQKLTVWTFTPEVIASLTAEALAYYESGKDKR